MLPAVMNSHFMRVSDVHNHSTRQMNDLYLPKPRTNYRKFSVAYQAPLIWNSIDLEIRNCATDQSFKKRFFNYLIVNNYP